MARTSPRDRSWESVRTAPSGGLLAALAAVAVLAALGLARGSGSGRSPDAGSGATLEVATTRPAAGGTGEVVGRVRRTPAAPVPPRQDAQAVWTGREVLVWSGMVGTDADFEPVAGGAALEVGTDRWRVLPPAPIRSRTGAAAVWAGDRMVVWGGFAGPDEPLDDGAAYLPGEDRWESLPPAPLSARGDMVAVWTGSEVLLVGGAEQPDGSWSRTAGAQRDGAAFDPARRRWRPLPPVPDGVWPVRRRFAGAWARDLLVVWGRDLAAYDPDADAWQRVAAPASSLWPVATVQAVAVDGEVAVLGLALRDRADTFGFLYSPRRGAFAPVPRLRTRASMTGEFRAAATVGGLVAIPSAGFAVTWRPGAAVWGLLPAELTERTGAVAVPTGDGLAVWGGWDGRSPRADGLVWTP